MRTDILFLHPSKLAAKFKDYANTGAASPYMIVPVGVSGMMNMLQKEGFQVCGLDVPMEMLINPEFDLETWLQGLQGLHLIAIDLHWYEHSFGALDLVSLCKQVLPTVPVVLGGLTASFFADEIMQDFPKVDFIIRGDGEKPLLELAKAMCREENLDLGAIPNLVYRNKSQVVKNEMTYCAAQADLDQLNFVDMDFLTHADQLAEVIYNLSEKVEMTGEARRKGHWLTIGRGCIYNCSFCGGGNYAHKTIAGRQNIIARSPERVVDDLERLQQQGYQQVSLNLDPAIMGKEYWTRLFAEIRRRSFKIGLYIEFFQLPSIEFIEELLPLVDIPHTELAFSPLSGSDRVRRLNGKHYSNAQLMAVLRLLRTSGLAVFIYFSLNIPFEDAKSFQHTLRLAGEISRSYPSGQLRMINMLHTVDPCSPMSRQAKPFNLKVEFKRFKDYYTYCQETPVLKPDFRLSDWRGYRSLGTDSTALTGMAAQWDDFCAHQPSRCYPVPHTW
jgi:tRNA A37 methylthiotransferase MiaB